MNTADRREMSGRNDDFKRETNLLYMITKKERAVPTLTGVEGEFMEREHTQTNCRSKKTTPAPSHDSAGDSQGASNCTPP